MNKLSFPSTGLTVSPQSENVSFRSLILLHCAQCTYLVRLFFCLIVFHLHMYFPFCHGHGLFLQFFGFFRSLKDLFTSAYNTGSQAVIQEANL